MTTTQLIAAIAENGYFLSEPMYSERSVGPAGHVREWGKATADSVLYRIISANRDPKYSVVVDGERIAIYFHTSMGVSVTEFSPINRKEG